MKKRTIYKFIMILICLGIFMGYRIWDKLRTDTVAPEIHFAMETPEITLMGPEADMLQGITATDDRDGDVTDSLVVESIRMTRPEEKIAAITLAAFDRSGNVAKVEQEVICKDYHSPRFSLSEPLAFPNNSAMNVLRYITAEDVIDGDLTQNIRATVLTEESIGTLGIHQVEFRVSNSMGETARLELPVEVYEAGTYEADLYLTDYLIYLEQGDSFNARNYLKDFKLYSEEFSLSDGLPASFELETYGQVDTDTPGVYTISYTVTYSRGVTSVRSFAGYSKLIVVVEG